MGFLLYRTPYVRYSRNHMAKHKDIQRIRAIATNRLPEARSHAIKLEITMLQREALADSQRPIKRAIQAISANGGTLSATDRDALHHAEAVIDSAKTSRRAYEADIADVIKPRHVACGPAKAIQGRAHYEVLRANHASSDYVAICHSDGLYSHSEAISGPGLVDGIDVMSTRLPSTDALASASIGLNHALDRHAKTVDRAIATANKLSARSHRRSSKRGRRNRGKGGKGLQSNARLLDAVKVLD